MIKSYNDLKIKDYKRIIDGDNPIEVLTEKPLNDILVSEIDNISID